MKLDQSKRSQKPDPNQRHSNTQQTSYTTRHNTTPDRLGLDTN